jgi:hypothetical protein
LLGRPIVTTLLPTAGSLWRTWQVTML